MTGYGKVDYEDERICVSVEVRSINAKYADISLRLPKALLAQEVAWRNLVIAQLGRGKITLEIGYTLKEARLPSMQINQDLFKVYYTMLLSMAQEVGASVQGLFQLALQSPEVATQVESSTISGEDKKIVEEVVHAALQQCDQSRKAEGEALATALKAYIRAIKEGLMVIERLDPARIEAIRTKLRAGVAATAMACLVDENRLEQELIYYIERLDITEERVRLARHLAYFEEVMESCQAEGKKLGFIVQEIGREINTLGAKASDGAIQQEVICMKDEVEKIKEQLCNIL